MAWTNGEASKLDIYDAAKAESQFKSYKKSFPPKGEWDDARYEYYSAIDSYELYLNDTAKAIMAFLESGSIEDASNLKNLISQRQNYVRDVATSRLEYINICGIELESESESQPE